jgi:hypothetical protein
MKTAPVFSEYLFLTSSHSHAMVFSAEEMGMRRTLSFTRTLTLILFISVVVAKDEEEEEEEDTAMMPDEDSFNSLRIGGGSAPLTDEDEFPTWVEQAKSFNRCRLF